MVQLHCHLVVRCAACAFYAVCPRLQKISFPCVVVLRNDARGGVAASVLAEVVMVAWFVVGDCDDIRGACGGSTFSDLSLRLCDHLQRPFVVLCEVFCSNHPSSSSKDQWCHRAFQELLSVSRRVLWNCQVVSVARQSRPRASNTIHKFRSGAINVLLQIISSFGGW